MGKGVSEMTDWDLIARKVGFASERELLEDFYYRRQLTTAQIATLLQTSRQHVCQRLKFYGIALRPRGGANNLKGVQLLLHRLDQRDVWLRPKQLSVQLKISLSAIYKLRKENL